MKLFHDYWNISLFHWWNKNLIKCYLLFHCSEITKKIILHNRYVLLQYGIDHVSACILFLFTRPENITHSLVRNIISELVNKKPYAHSNIKYLSSTWRIIHIGFKYWYLIDVYCIYWIFCYYGHPKCDVTYNWRHQT